jgi:hypothetical protein
MQCDSIEDIDEWLSGATGSLDFSEYIFEWYFDLDWTVTYENSIWEKKIENENDFESSIYIGVWKLEEDAFSVFSHYDHFSYPEDFNPDLGYAYLYEDIFYTEWDVGSPSIPIGLGIGDSLTITTNGLNTYQSVETFIYPEDTVVNQTIEESTTAYDITLTFLGIVDVVLESGTLEDVAVIKRNSFHIPSNGEDFTGVTYHLYSLNNLMLKCFSIKEYGEHFNIHKYDYPDIDFHPLSIDEMRPESELELYPNPTSDYINLKQLATGTITIFDLQGRIIREFPNSQNRYLIEVGFLDPGIYLLCDSDKYLGRFQVINH